LAHSRFGDHRQAPLDSAVGHRGDSRLGQHPRRVELAGRLDDPRQHQIPQHRITVENTIEPQRLIDPAQGIPQMAGPRTRNLQRPAADTGGLQAQIHYLLTVGQPLGGHGL
jgi:hypothetical protein